MRRTIIVLIAVLGICLIPGCGKRYVGDSVNYSWEGWCQYAEYYNYNEKHCRVPSGPLIFDFTITKGDMEHEYKFEGYIDPTQGDVKSWDQMVEGKSFFHMLVANDGVIVDNVSFRPRTAYGGLGREMPFTINYINSEGFDAVCFYWSMVIRG